jgi:hypothetical protein
MAFIGLGEFWFMGFMLRLRLIGTTKILKLKIPILT